MSDFFALAANFNRRAANLPKVVSDLTVTVAGTILARLVQDTPVDTSRALSNWQVALDSPVNFSILPYVEGSKGSTYAQSWQEAFSVGNATLASKKPGQAIYISNNLTYIQKLNEGSSAQAPAGFVQADILIGASIVRYVKLNL